MTMKVISRTLVATLLVAADAFLLPKTKTQRRNAVLSPLSSTVAEPTSLTTNDAESAPHQDDVDEDKFNWFKAWYPVVPVEILDPEVPHKFQLLGMDLVVWKDAAVKGHALFQSKKDRPRSATRTGGTWRVFVDECPHRKVPLSEGRVEDDGSLLCSYHGWRFNGFGGLVDAPQLDSTTGAETLGRIKSNPKSRCNAFPTQVIDGLLWVWPETGDDARIESALTPAPAYQIPAENPNAVWKGPWNYRQLPYGADYFIENVVDPAHVEVSHHNVVGSRYNDQTRSMKAVTKVTKNGFAIESEVPNQDGGAATTTYQAPALVSIETDYSQGAKQVLELYASPSLPGHCNHVGRVVVIKDKSGKMPKLLRQFTLPMPTWLNHILASAFLNQDALFLHHQERQMHRTGKYSTLNDGSSASAQDYTQAVLPIETDRGVLNYRNWIRVLAGGRIPYKFNPAMPEPNNEVVFDVWNGHTKYCKLCQRALGNLKKARFAAFFVATCLGVLRPAGNKILNLVGTLAATGMGLALNKLIGMFYRYEFSHGHND